MAVKNNKKFINNRLLWLDALRGFAIFLMIIFHFCYDLRYFGWVDWNIPNGSNWWPFRYFIIFLFTFAVGLSLSLAHQKTFKRIVFINRVTKILLGAVCVTVMSLILFPQAWIYFGILHFIALGSVISVAFVKRPKISIGVGLLILVGFWTNVLSDDWPFKFFNDLLPRPTEDFVPLIPWLGVMLIGQGVSGLVNLKRINLSCNKITKSLAAMGKHGLIIYLIHQPILFAGFIVVDQFV